MSRTTRDSDSIIDLSDRIVHLEVLRGGMNRLLFRTNRSETWNTRIEVYFANVKYLAVSTLLRGPTFERLGAVHELPDLVPPDVAASDDMSVYGIEWQGGEGIIVAAAMAVDVSEASAQDPSRFF